MSEPFAYHNGRFLPQAQVAIALNDAGLVFGATVTDLCRTFRHELFRLDDHLVRFRQSCNLAHVPQPRTDDEVTVAARELVARNAKLIGADQDLALVMLATPGEIGYYSGQPGGPGDATPNLYLHTFPLPFRRYVGLMREGAHLVVPPTRHLPPSCVPPQIKQRSRLFWWLAEQEAHAIDPNASALLLDADGFITETAAANILLVRDGKVLSPRRARILGGISLQTIQELCRELGMAFEEADLRLEDCRAADEAMLACTSYCLAPVRRLDGYELGCPGPVYQRLLAAWSVKVSVDIRGQVLG